MDNQALMDNKGSTKKAGIEEEDKMATYNFTMLGKLNFKLNETQEFDTKSI